MKAIATAFALVASLAACTDPPIKYGQVIRKEYEPEHVWVQIVPITISNGKTTSTIIVPMIHRDDEDFVVIVQGWTAEGEFTRQRWYAPDRAAWDAIREGDMLDSDSGVVADDPVEKTRQS